MVVTAAILGQECGTWAETVYDAERRFAKKVQMKQRQTHVIARNGFLFQSGVLPILTSFCNRRFCIN